MDSCEYSIVDSSDDPEDTKKKMTSKWAKFRLLMWKNYLLNVRHPFQTVIEILIPVFFCALLVMVRSLVTPTVFTKPQIYKPLNLGSFFDILQANKDQPLFKLLSFKQDLKLDNYTLFKPEIVYSPKNDALETLMEIVQKSLGTIITSLASVNSSEELTPYLIQTNSYVGVEFPDSYSTLTKLPDDIKYCLRFPGELRSTGGTLTPLNFNWRTNFLFPMWSAGGARNYYNHHDGIPSGYYVEGFVFVQQFIFKAFTSLKNKLNITEDLPKIQMRRFPYPAMVVDILLQGLQGLVPLLILLSFVYPCINIIKYITREKEKQLKEAMKIMGLDSWLHWVAWFTKCFIYMFFTVTLMTILVKTPFYGHDNPNSVFTNSSGTAIWFFLMIYSITTIMFCFMVSVFFSKASTAAAVAGLVWFLIYTPYMIAQTKYELLSFATKIFMSFFCNTAMAFGFNIILRYEGTDEGLQWSNMFVPVSVDDDFHVGFVIIMLIIDAIIYLLVALYVEKILPGDYGVAEPWNFPFTAKFWFNIPEYTGVYDVESNGVHSSNLNYEQEPKNQTAGIRIKNLRKVYGNKKVAVEGLNLNMYEGQITVLLGHNGAGKTTTMSMLTGMIPASTGTAIINGKDIRHDINIIRSSIGFCPQHNILFEDMTVREHIIFFSMLKGFRSCDANREVEKYIKLLKLENKADCLAGRLSGGMKRRLSVGIALCANSKTVLFDEPSSGVDPGSRRDLWDMLQQEKKGRTILLSTHFMLEADVLGDRIAIMSNGILKAVGSPFFLKKRFGIGYRLVCSKSDIEADSSGVTNLLKKYIPDVEKEAEVGSELSYTLDDRNVLVFQEMLQDLEENSETLNIESYGISLSTLEEVFLKIGTDDPDEEKSPMVRKKSVRISTNVTRNTYPRGSAIANYNYSDRLQLMKGRLLYLNQFFALLHKKILNTCRNLILLFIQILIPIMYSAITIMILSSMGGGKDLPAINLSVDTYRTTVTTLQADPTSWTDSLESKIFESYRGQFEGNKMASLNVISEDLNDYYLKKEETILTRLNRKYLFGASIEKSKVTAWFNNQPYHTSAISLNLVHNAILKTYCGSNCSISVVNKPLPYKADTKILMTQAGNNLGFQLSFNMGFAMTFVASFYVIMYVRERVTKAKHLQFVSGVNVLTYWGSAFVWDYILFLIISLLTILTIGAFQEKGFDTFEDLGRIYLLLMLFGFALLPFIYNSAFIFEGSASAFIKLSIFFIFFGPAMYTVVFTLNFDGFNLKDVARKLTWIFLMVPHFGLSNGMVSLNQVNVLREVCDQLCKYISICGQERQCKFNPKCCNLDPFAWEEPGILRNIIFFVIIGILGFVLLFLIEFRVMDVVYYKIRKVYRAVVSLINPNFILRSSSQSMNTDDEDDDVKREKELINNMEPSDYKNHTLVMKNVTKYYKNFLAVNQLSVGIKSSECFGLLGVNGAGKTSTFRMLTGDAKISDGDAFVQELSLKTKMEKVHKRIGYCPQFDALIEELTGRETLKLFALCRGIPKYTIDDVIRKLARDFNFTKYLDKLVRTYSGGNKRKLSTAVALLGNPVIIYLDEPTTGMDIGAKRNLWDVMNTVRNAGKTIILTSHSMEECEALCTRIAIMVNGQFKCLGSTQHLKSKFGQGFVLTVKVKRFTNETTTDASQNELARIESNEMLNERNAVKDFVEQEFRGAVLKEEYYDLLTFYVPTTDIKWSQIFGTLEQAKKSLNIEDYSIAQSTLEQIFLLFTKYQRPTDE